MALMKVSLGLAFALSAAAVQDESEIVWGCGLLGPIPGIKADGSVEAETQKLVDALKTTSSLGKVSYWNWNFAPMRDDDSGEDQYLSKDFLFMPEQWGVEAVNVSKLREAGQSDFIDELGEVSHAEMANILLGANEPDMIGSCMGDMMGKCTGPCDDEDKGNCPIAKLDNRESAEPNERGHCECYSQSHATGVGFWPLEGCSAYQPLPELWSGSDPKCVDQVMSAWDETVKAALSKGYKYFSTPLAAVNIDWARSFLERACQCQDGNCGCTDASCGCPVFVGFHFYGYDCLPKSSGDYDLFKAKLDKVAKIMEDYPFVQGAIINEVGMLNCDSKNPDCIPNSGKYPAINEPEHACPSTEELPNGLSSFMEDVFEMVIAAKTSDGRPVVKGFSWFNENMEGGTYNLRLFDDAGKVNSVGEAYMKGCSKWSESFQDKSHTKTTAIVI